ncbi:MAG: hypothetical protein HC845_03930 [Akkermansiaceae bacterium]|nr:hypothetical protein [Akkermansiaceae bacterium]
MAPSKQLADSLLNSEGLYTLADAAYFARIPISTLSSWFFGRGDHVYRHARLAALPEKLLTFEEFIEAIAIRSLREQGFSLKTILAALTQAELLFDAKRVFTNPNFDFLAEKKGKRLFVSPHASSPVGLEGKKDIGQLSFEPVIKDYLDLIEFDADHNALAYRPLKSDEFNIALNPSRSFGEPIVEQVGYPARTLIRALKEEGSVERAAWMYGVPEGAIKLAEKYEKYLREIPKNIAA